jgi:ubiquinone biosynthesis monooxygenase Coq7
MGDRAPHSAEIRAMAEQEHRHLRAFDALAAERGVRPTALRPLWSVAGTCSAPRPRCSVPKAAMACTAAVEEEIDRHYTRQLDRLEQDGGFTSSPG